MRLFATVFAASLSVAAPALADRCDDADDQATLNRCADEAYRAADARLNADYSKIMTRLADDADARRRLQTSQRAWIAFRDAECAFATAGAVGGSIQPMLLAGCLQGLTEARAGQLDGYLHCEEGDLGCPVPGE